MSDAAVSKAYWIDSHAHLTMFEKHEVVEVVQRAADANVRRILVPATNRDDLDLAVGIAEEHAEVVVAAAGVHPHDAASLDGGLKRMIEGAMAHPKVVAVGEIGLDYHYMNSPREDQVRALAWQLGLAAECDKPVILHNRESWDDLAETVSAFSSRLRGVCHSFTEGPEQAREVVEWGLLVGISGMVTFKQADNIREMAAVLQASQVMVETDSPFLAPVPHRGKRNEPALVVHVGRRLAEVLELPADELAAATTSNFLQLFESTQE